jgi:cytochrome bd-type quinol oxidase subunit 2
LQNALFEITYFGLGGVLAGLLLTVVITASRQARAFADPKQRAGSISIALAGVGVAVVLIAGVGLDSIKNITGGAFFQIAHFAAFYAAFGLVLYGADHMASSILTTDSGALSGHYRPLRVGIWTAYVTSLLIAGWLLASAAITAAANGSAGELPQQPIYFLPVLLALGISGLIMLLLAVRPGEPTWLRSTVGWFAAFAGLGMIGSLREATIIPSTGNPQLDLLIAFLPFTAGGVCLFVSGRFVSRGRAPVT